MRIDDEIIELHTFVIAVMGLGISGYGFGSQLGVAGVFVVCQFILVTRCLIGEYKEWGQFLVSEVIVLFLCAVALAMLKS